MDAVLQQAGVRKFGVRETSAYREVMLARTETAQGASDLQLIRNGAPFSRHVSIGAFDHQIARGCGVPGDARAVRATLIRYHELQPIHSRPEGRARLGQPGS